MANGILLLNLGSPDSPAEADVKKYLRQFLMDKRVMDVPYLIRKAIIEFSILPKRPKESAHAYQSIWWPEGSPLLVISKKVQQLLQQQVNAPVALGMRYGKPTCQQAFKELLEKTDNKLSEVFVIPLYPHYAMSSYETAIANVRDAIRKMKLDIVVKNRAPFYQDPLYIEALVASSQQFLDWDFDHMLFTYHGLPERHLCKSDPTKHHCLKVTNCCKVTSVAHESCYRHQVYETTEAFVKKANIPQDKYSVSFQSRLGKDPWIKPYTDLEIARLAKEGVKKLLLISPAFVADCLETLEELGMRAKEDFLAAGGEEMRLIPCLNEHPLWIKALTKWCVENGIEKISNT